MDTAPAVVVKPEVKDSETQTDLTLLRMKVYSNNSHSPKSQALDHYPGQLPEDFIMQANNEGAANFKMMMRPMFSGSRVSLVNRPQTSMGLGGRDDCDTLNAHNSHSMEGGNRSSPSHKSTSRLGGGFAVVKSNQMSNISRNDPPDLVTFTRPIHTS